MDQTGTQPEKQPFIHIEPLHFSYKDNAENGAPRIVPVLKDISLDLDRGDYVAVLGHNGSGKSTLAKLLNLILTPDSGKIVIDGLEVTENDSGKGLSEAQLFETRCKIGMVFQNPDNQLVATIVEEDVAFGPENMGVPSAEIRRRVDAALDMVGMRSYARHSPHQLSGGQKQRIAIAGIIAMQPQCIIFDESTAMLDPSGRREVIETMEKLNRENGITILHITHNMEEAVRANRVIVINDGEIFLDGTPREVFSHVDELLRVGLDVPQSTELIYELNKRGYHLPTDLLFPDECAEAILTLFH